MEAVVYTAVIAWSKAAFVFCCCDIRHQGRFWETARINRSRVTLRLHLPAQVRHKILADSARRNPRTPAPGTLSSSNHHTQVSPVRWFLLRGPCSRVKKGDFNSNLSGPHPVVANRAGAILAQEDWLSIKKCSPIETFFAESETGLRTAEILNFDLASSPCNRLREPISMPEMAPCVGRFVCTSESEVRDSCNRESTGRVLASASSSARLWRPRRGCSINLSIFKRRPHNYEEAFNDLCVFVLVSARG